MRDFGERYLRSRYGPACLEPVTSIFSGPAKPKQAVQQAPPPVPTTEDPAVVARRKDEEQARKRRRGRAASILTPGAGLGDTSEGTLVKPVVLGQTGA